MIKHLAEKENKDMSKFSQDRIIDTSDSAESISHFEQRPNNQAAVIRAAATLKTVQKAGQQFKKTINVKNRKNKTINPSGLIMEQPINHSISKSPFISEHET